VSTQRAGRSVPDLYLEIPTAGRNIEALVSTVSVLVKRRELVRAGVYPDDGCPALGSHSMRGCTCEIVGVRLSYFDPSALTP
jgi:hypothetical protein